MNDLAAQEVDGGLFDESGEEEELKLITLMARNYSIHEEMQGGRVQLSDPEIVDGKKDTVGEMVGVMYSERG